MYKVYIIYSLKLDRYYIGHTENIAIRLQRHIHGISVFTASADDWVLKYIEEFETRAAAHARERQIKKKKSRRYIEWLINSAG